MSAAFSSLPTELLQHVVAMHFCAAGLHSVVTTGRMLTMCRTMHDSAEALWQKVAELFVLPLQPLLTNVPSFNVTNVQLIVKKLRSSHCGAMEFVGRQREAESLTQLNAGACSEHDFIIRLHSLHGACIRWRCTRAAPGECAARSWITDPVDIEHGPRGFTLRSKNLTGSRFDPCEYVFEVRHNGLLAVLREAKVLGGHKAPLHQVAWGVVNLGRMLQTRVAVLPMPA